VIPDHHGRGHFLENAAFCDWLKAQVAAGHEAVLHGYRHQRKAQPSRGSIVSPWITEIYTAGEGEFFDINYETAGRFLDRGLRDFRQIGLTPAGFIAPAWLLGAGAERAVRDADFRYTTRLRGVLDLRSNQFHRSQSLCWSVRAAWRRVLSRAWNASLFRRLRNAPLLRIAVHPVDIAHPRIWTQICKLIEASARDRTPHTYESWLAMTEPHAVSP
jgi:hypothetical protein